MKVKYEKQIKELHSKIDEVDAKNVEKDKV